MTGLTGSAGSFRFDGRKVVFRDGDTIAAALHRAGILQLARSRKFHRARGLSGSFIVGHLAAVDGQPHVRLDVAAATEALAVTTENVWPGAAAPAGRL